jgi:hypothetical protein
MPRIATRLAGPAQLTNAAATKFTVAAGELNIIRKIHVSNPTGTAVNFTASIGADAAATRIFDAFPVPANSVLDAFGPYTMNAGEVFQASASTTLVMNLTVDGDRSILG